MTIDELDDLKQFMTALISQTEVRLGERIDQLDKRLSSRIDGLAADMNSGFAGIADIIEAHNQQLDNHEERLVKLEQQAA